ncbi:hypothetical protein OOK31_01305 [Streptomyces sp. NBC_00249]|uniref:hypothetical protein n=1 Tax=Streptomyces sp. NBC_00249 TaxID=2975690 RepID=UPI00225983B7|nr:hypothetical protein [Streptomyces sp. NBC_00249]MCX5192537.1 hypothetical protein [Streptomyces sp. NBC_00249]
MRLLRRAIGSAAVAGALALALVTPANAAPAPVTPAQPAAAAAVGPVQLYFGGLGSGPYNIAVEAAVRTALDQAANRGFAPAQCRITAGPTVVNQLPNGYVQVAVDILCTGEPTVTSPTFVLYRYHKSSDTISTPWNAPAGYQLQGPLGTLHTSAAPGTQPLYLCVVRGDHFATTDVNCEGQTYVTRLGWLYASPPAGVGSLPLLRCLRKENRQIFESHKVDCEGQIIGGTLGYVLA